MPACVYVPHMHLRIFVWPFDLCTLPLSYAMLPSNPISHTYPPVIDLEAFGFGGKLPDILAKSIKTSQADEPLLWDSILTDPVAKRAISDPMAVVKEVVDAAMDASGYAH